MQTKRDFLKTSAVIIGTNTMSYVVQAATLTQKFLLNTMPHYHEFNTAQNPNGNGWCGHTVLKIAGNYVSGQDKTLTQIHNIFYANSLAYRQNRVSSGFQWCASLSDLMWAAGLSQNGGYGRPVAQQIGTFTTDADFFTKIKNAIDNNWPVIIPSNWKYTNVGHFWVVVGYIDTGDVTTSSIHLRDVAIATPRGQLADWSVKAQDFIYSTPIKQMLIMK